MLVGPSVLDALSTIPFFAGLERLALERVAAGMRARRFRRGEVIFHIGDPGDALFVIVQGEVKISLPSETGDEAILATLRSGDVFGELALLDGAPRSASATAISPTETVVLPHPGAPDREFCRSIVGHPGDVRFPRRRRGGYARRRLLHCVRARVGRGSCGLRRAAGPRRRADTRPDGLHSGSHLVTEEGYVGLEFSHEGRRDPMGVSRVERRGRHPVIVEFAYRRE